VPDGLFDGVAEDIDSGIKELQDSKKKERKANHVVLLAKNEEGYRNILRLSSLAYLEGFYYKPRIDLSMLARHSSGIIATSACLGVARKAPAPNRSRS
jgi:DNA polymerase III alpha subunit